MDYRIIIETETSGKKWYYVQRRYLIYFWRYLREVRDISMYAYKIGWHSLEEAEAHIQSDVNTRYANDQKKIVKREYFEKIEYNDGGPNVKGIVIGYIKSNKTQDELRKEQGHGFIDYIEITADELLSKKNTAYHNYKMFENIL